MESENIISSIKIIKSDRKKIENLRNGYLNFLPEFQELYLELLFEKAEIYKLLLKEETIGYFAKTDNILVEFYVLNKIIPLCNLIFQIVIKRYSLAKIYCKSFDHILLNCCILHSCKYKPIGLLFRDYVDSEKYFADDFVVRFAQNSDYKFLLQQNSELYESADELKRFIDNRNIIMFERNGRLSGCGFLIRIIKNRDFYDIGMWVNPDFRKQGIATHIISHLKDICLKKNWKPICGCAIENIASKKTLEKNGFVSKHTLIEFEIKPDMFQ